MVYLGDLKSKSFGLFIMTAREMNKEVAFGHIDYKQYHPYDLFLLERDEEFAETPNRFSLFMFRRGNFLD